MPLKFKKPLFITFEGGEGTGKTTQINEFSKWLRSKDVNFIQTREPGGVPEAEEIRKKLLNGDKDKYSPHDELLLFSKARNLFFNQRVMPALEQGKTVVSDRFADSTTVYQGYAGGLSQQQIDAAHKTAFNNQWPDITFILDIPVEIGLARANKRGEEENRFEKKGSEFHECIRNGFLRVAKENPERCILINVEGLNITELHSRIQTAFLKKAEENNLLCL